MKGLSIIDNISADIKEGITTGLFNKEQVEEIKSRLIDNIALKLKDSQAELSNEELVKLLTLALQYLRSNEEVLETFDVVLGERIQSGAFKPKEFA